ncbi:MAG TPA: hypothetical protein VMH35_15105 [Streptosporangiaceae bacterium]|nr:hypothetical protein [Streptosporangiaceae bacterium]
MAIMMVIGHAPDGHDEHVQHLAARLNQESTRRFQLLLDEKLTRTELGPVVAYPLLRVHFRWSDRPGALLNVLDSLSKALHSQFPAINENKWSVSYGRTQAPAGRAAVARLTVRLHASRDEVESWNLNNEDLERKVRTRAALEAVAGYQAGPGEEPDIPEDPVISVNLIWTPPVNRDERATAAHLPEGHQPWTGSWKSS